MFGNVGIELLYLWALTEISFQTSVPTPLVLPQQHLDWPQDHGLIEAEVKKLRCWDYSHRKVRTVWCRRVVHQESGLVHNSLV